MPTLSEAVVTMLTMPETAAPLAGLVINTLGSVVSGGGGGDSVKFFGEPESGGFTPPCISMP